MQRKKEDRLQFCKSDKVDGGLKIALEHHNIIYERSDHINETTDGHGYTQIFTFTCGSSDLI